MIKIKFIKDTELKKIGDIVNCSQKSAETYVSQGYAEYVEEVKGINLKEEWEKHKASKPEKEEIYKEIIDRASKIERSTYFKLYYDENKKELTWQIFNKFDKFDYSNTFSINTYDFATDFSAHISGKSDLLTNKQFKLSKIIEEYIIKCKGESKDLLKEEWEKHKASKPTDKVAESDVKELLKAEAQVEEVAEYKEDEINWLDNSFYDSWDKVKGHAKKIMGHHEDYSKDEDTKLFFLAHSKDTIRGRPQLVGSVKNKIPLVTELVKKVADMEEDENGKQKKVGDKQIKKIFMFDEKFDGRYDGYLAQKHCLNFWIYSIVHKGILYYVYSKDPLQQGFYELSGMIVERDDHAELSKSLKQKTISNVFLLKEAKPSIKIYSKEELIQITKQLNQQVGLTRETFKDFLAFNPLMENFNRYSPEFEDLRASVILSGQEANFPNHLMLWGEAGTLKTAHLECIYHKFPEEQDVMDVGIYGGNSKITGLVPSFKSTPTDVGYLYKCQRLGAIDEFGKLVEKERNKHESQISNNLAGELNDAFDQKERYVGSGNSGTSVKATAKYLINSNPISSKPTIMAHVGLLDPPWMSRMIHWVQDEEEQKFIQTSGIQQIPPTPLQDPTTKEFSPHTYSRLYTNSWKSSINNNNKLLVLSECRGELLEEEGNFNPFMSIFDSCYGFVSEIDDKEVIRLNGVVLSLMSSSIMNSVWKAPRSLHHIKLLVDGLCKLRCLFEDHDSSFKATQEDYDLAERILVRMVKGWDTILTPKEGGYPSYQ